MTSLIKRLWTEESGQGMAEYGLILALVAIAVIVALGLMGDSINEKFKAVTEKLDEATVE